MNVLERIEESISRSEHLSRRSFLGRLTKGSVVLTGALGGLAFASGGRAGGICRTVACCSLLYCPDCPDCSCTGSCYSPSAWSWVCTWTGGDGCQYQCIECPGCSCSCAVRLCTSNCPCFGEGGTTTRTKYLPVGSPERTSAR